MLSYFLTLGSLVSFPHNHNTLTSLYYKI